MGLGWQSLELSLGGHHGSRRCSLSVGVACQVRVVVVANHSAVRVVAPPRSIDERTKPFVEMAKNH